MKFPEWLEVVGDQSYRGDCPKEDAELITFFNQLRKRWPATWGSVATHVKNEGRKHFQQAAKDKAKGQVKGAPDIFIPYSPAVLIELKRKDHTGSSWIVGQQEYMKAAQDMGAHVYVALGAEAAIRIIEKYEQCRICKPE